MRQLAVLATACTVGLGAAGCSVLPAQTLNQVSVQEHISAWLTAAYRVPVGKVVCPTQLPGQPGARFDCTTTLAGSPVMVSGVIADAAGHFKVSLDQAVIDTRRASHALAAQLTTPNGAPVRVDCGASQVKVVTPGASFQCTATGSGVTTRLTGTAADLQGTVRYTVPPTVTVVAPTPPPPTAVAGPAGAPAPGSTTIAPSKPSTTTPPATAAPPITLPPVTTVTTLPPITAPPTTNPPTTTPPVTIPPITVPPATAPPASTGSGPAPAGPPSGASSSGAADPVGGAAPAITPARPQPAASSASSTDTAASTAGATPASTVAATAGAAS